MREEDGPVDFDELRAIIRSSLGIGEEEAGRIAEVVLSYFGFETHVVDNVLSPEDRKLFYSLYDAGILASHYEETLLENGRIWRIFYWDFDLDSIKRKESRKQNDEDGGGGIYSSLPPSAWKRKA